MTTQHELIGSDLLAAKVPILRETALLIADPQVRYVGTLGGNVANGDPGNDMPAVMMCLDATYESPARAAAARFAARDFYESAYVTALEPGEIVTAIRIPRAGRGPRLGLREAEAQGRRLRDRRGRRGPDPERRQGRRACSIGLTNVADTPLLGRGGGADRWSARRSTPPPSSKAVAAAEAITSPASDSHGPAAYRTKMAGVMLSRALARAKARAT